MREDEGVARTEQAGDSRFVFVFVPAWPPRARQCVSASVTSPFCGRVSPGGQL